MAHAQENSDYYSAVMRECAIDPTRCRPQDFPILTKTEVMRNFDRIVTDSRVTRKKLADFLEHSKDPSCLFDDEFLDC